MNRSLYVFLLVGIGIWVRPVFSQVRLARVFTDHAVLQRQKPLFIWGWAPPGQTVTVSLAGQTVTTRSAADSSWRVKLQPLEAGGPFQLLVKGKTNQVKVEDVLVGEVWVCSGQSNMEFKVRQALRAEDEIRAAKDPLIRQFFVTHTPGFTPAKDVAGTWTVSSPKTTGDFTAVGYFFARQMRQELNVPIGLVNTSWGGTHAETWTSREGLNQDEELRTVANKLPLDGEVWKQQRLDSVTRRFREKQGGTPPDLALASRWMLPQTDTYSWPLMNLPSHWERRGLAGLRGIVWFRKEIELPPGTRLSPATLHLGPLGETDSTFVNGHWVGSERIRAIPRQYVLPPNLLQPGRNLIAVRILDSLFMGGFIGAPAQLRLTLPDTTLSLAGDWQYKPVTLFPSSANALPNDYATLLFNGMIHPIIPVAMRGVLWYQGESNAPRAYQYRRTFPLLIQDWRQHWQTSTGTADAFPFLFVQLANFQATGGNSQRGSTWAELREAQTMALKLPNTGMAVTSDLGESADIHPRNKQDVGRRLAAEALRVAYGQPVVSSGPTFVRFRVEGQTCTLTFTNTGSGLMTPDKYGYLRGFEMAGADQVYKPARADIRGNQVLVWSDAVATPVAVRYGWADDNGEVNLYNREGFPAVPFRTDTWKGITENNRFGKN